MKIPIKTKDRLSKVLAQYQKILRQAKDRDVNESDTVTIVVDILAAVFGFDKFSEITSEQSIRGTFCDLAVTVDGQIQFLIEVKAIGLNLKDNHLRQAINYGANHGISWVILTNGIEWQIYRLRFEKPIAFDLVCPINLLEMSARSQSDQEKLFLLCKEGISKAAIEDFHKHISIVNRFAVAAILQQQSVLNMIRKEIRTLADGIKVENEEILKILINEVLKREVVSGQEAEEISRKLKNKNRRNSSRKMQEAEKADFPDQEIETEIFAEPMMAVESMKPQD